MSRSQDEQSLQEKQDLVDQISKKKNGAIDKDWSEICSEFDLNLNTETQRKAGVGIKLVSDANMIRDALSSTINDLSGGYVERQKLRDQTGKVNEIYRSEARSELLRETIAQAIKDLPKIELQYAPRVYKWDTERQLVLGLGDIHYGADIHVEGLNGETLNEFNHEVFEERMEKLFDETYLPSSSTQPMKYSSLINLILSPFISYLPFIISKGSPSFHIEQVTVSPSKTQV